MRNVHAIAMLAGALIGTTAHAQHIWQDSDLLVNRPLPAAVTVDPDQVRRALVEQRALEFKRLLEHSEKQGWQSTMYCIRTFEGDSLGVYDTGRNGVYGYDILEATSGGTDSPSSKPPINYRDASDKITRGLRLDSGAGAICVVPRPLRLADPALACFGVYANGFFGTDDPPAKTEEKPKAPPTTPPTLDELLGIKPGTPATDKPKTSEQPEKPTTDADADPTKADLNRRLTGQELTDAFKQAVALMGDASTRLNERKDPGLDTQRVQEDAIKRLDQLIASLSKKQQGKPDPNAKPQQGKEDPKNSAPPQGGKPGGKSQAQPSKGGDGQRKDLGPTLQEGALNPQLESARAAWGSLPARIRDMLMQGTEDRFSARYKALTQEYYKRLAEENSK